jgi:hypothetical protein
MHGRSLIYNYYKLREILERETNSSDETGLMSEMAVAKLTDARDFKCMS